MATVDFPITIPNADVDRVTAALRRKFGMPLATQAEVVEQLRQQFCLTLEDLVYEAEVEAAREAVVAVTRIDAT